jgi:hypothetical protein
MLKDRAIEAHMSTLTGFLETPKNTMLLRFSSYIYLKVFKIAQIRANCMLNYALK